MKPEEAIEHWKTRVRESERLGRRLEETFARGVLHGLRMAYPRILEQPEPDRRFACATMTHPTTALHQ